MRFGSALIVFCLLLLCILRRSKSQLQFERQGREYHLLILITPITFIEDQVNFGPRVPNSEAHVQAKDYLVAQLEKSAGREMYLCRNFIRRLR